MSALVNMKGRRYGRLTVLDRAHGKTTNGMALWWTICVCGNKQRMRGENLRSHQCYSCGCLRAEMAKKQMLKIRHLSWKQKGAKKSKLQRCNNK